VRVLSKPKPSPLTDQVASPTILAPVSPPETVGLDMFRARWKRRFLLLSGLGVVLGGPLIALFVSLQHVPDFYQKALEDSRVTPIVAENVKQRTEKLIHEYEQSDSEINHWTETISEQECNAWLAFELPQRFPELNSQGLSNPRVRFADHLILLGCEFQGTRFSGVVSIAMRPRLSYSNTLTLEIVFAKIGQVPLPLNSLITEAQEFARKEKISLEGVVIEWNAISSGTYRGRLTLMPSHPTEMQLIATSIRVFDEMLEFRGERRVEESATTDHHQVEGDVLSIN
jgi:hypothetical protein